MIIINKSVKLVSPISKLNKIFFDTVFSYYSSTFSLSGYETAHDDYRVHHAPPESPISSSPIKQIKEISLKDIADIALTTLAFLSFGMFALQVLMCITMVIFKVNKLMLSI